MNMHDVINSGIGNIAMEIVSDMMETKKLDPKNEKERKKFKEEFLKDLATPTGFGQLMGAVFSKIENRENIQDLLGESLQMEPYLRDKLGADHNKVLQIVDVHKGMLKKESASKDPKP
jgi:hypothetical protein